MDTHPAVAAPSTSLPRHSAPRPRQLLWAAVSVAVCLALLGLLVMRVAAANHAVATTPARPLSGQLAPDMTITLWNGAGGAASQTIDLAHLRGQPIVLNFWASWCEACQQESPLLVSAWRQYHTRGVVFLGGALDTPVADGEQFLRQYAMPYPAGAVPTQATATAFHLIGLPATMFINRAGIVVTRVDGQLTAASLASGLRSLLA